MKRLLIALLLCGAPVAAWAAACTTSGAVNDCALEVCKFSDADTWTACGGAIPTTTDDVTVSNGDRVNFDVAAATVRSLRVNNGGQFLCPENAANRDANGYRVLTVTGKSATNDIILETNTTTSFRHGCKLILDSTTERIDINFSSPAAFFDFQGRVTETSVTAVVDNAATIGNCGASFTGTARAWTITVDQNRAPAVTAANAALFIGRRIMFRTGELRPRHFEIIDVPADGQIDICSGLLAADSNGQFLTPFVSIASQGRYSNLGTVQSITDDTAAWYSAPAAGDEISIVEDAYLLGDGANGQFFANAGAGYDTMPFYYATTVGGVTSSDTFGEATKNALGVWEVTASGTTVPRALSYNNLFGLIGVGGIRYEGVQDFDIELNALHDMPAGCSGCAVIILTETDNRAQAPADIGVYDNVIYRPSANGIWVTSGLIGNGVCSSNVSMRRNLGFDGITYGSQPPEPPYILRIDGCIDCDISLNRSQDWFAVGNDAVSSFGIHPEIAGDDCFPVGHASRNFSVNAGAGHLGGSGSDGLLSGVSAVGNYFSHSGRSGLSNGNLFGNIITDVNLFGLAVQSDRNEAVLAIPQGTVAGNALLGNPNTYSANECDNGVGNGCSGFGIYIENSWHQITAKPVTIMDNVIGFTDHDDAGGCFRVRADFDAAVTIDHNTCDGFRDTLTDSGTVTGFDLGSAPTTSTTYTLNDNLATHLNGGASVVCASDADLIDNAGTQYRVDSHVAAEIAGTSTGTCTTPATFVVGQGSDQYVDRSGFNYALRPNSSARTACSGSSVCGSRVFNFDMDPIEAVWGRVVIDGAMPPNFCNLPDEADGSINTDCIDSDGDGIVNLHDNCDLTPNPAQTDGDGDGKGCACDNGDTCP